MSHARKGISLHSPETRTLDRARGVSVFDTEEKARSHADRFPHLGRFVAHLDIPAGIRVERTGRMAGHFTVWAEPADLLAWVVRVRAIDLK